MNKYVFYVVSLNYYGKSSLIKLDSLIMVKKNQNYYYYFSLLDGDKCMAKSNS